MPRPTERADGRPGAQVVSAVLACAAAAAFVAVLAAFTFVRFPREVALFKARPGVSSTAFRRDFEMKRGPAGNLWTLEIELSGDLSVLKRIGFLFQTGGSQAEVRAAAADRQDL